MRYLAFEDLPVWQAARNLVKGIFRLTERDGFRRNWALRDQIQKAAISIMANIAEGFSRRSDREFIQFLFVSKASTAELRSHLYVALDLGYVDQVDFRAHYHQADDLAKQLSGFITYLTSQSQSVQEKQLSRLSRLSRSSR